MSDLLKVNACVYSRIGYDRAQNRDDFYMNGKFLSEQDIDNMEASLENRASEFFFAVADHMEYSDDEQKSNFSILRELRKFHEKISVQEGDIDFKTKELTTTVADTVKYLHSFNDINDIPDEAPERQLGFAGLLITEGKAIVSTYGTCHAYFCRDGVFKHITSGFSNTNKRLINLGIITIEEDEEPEDTDQDENEVNVFTSEPIELTEGDKFLLVSDGIYYTLGEELIQNILSMRSDSAYIANRIVSEAMKRNCSDDMTAMVVGIERIRSGAGAGSNTAKAGKQSAKPEASALRNVPPPTYKYKKSNIRKYENVIYYAAVFLTAILLILIMYFFIRNLMRNISNTEEDGIITPTPVVSVTPLPENEPEDTPEVTPEVTPEATPTEVPVQVHIVQSGETLSSIARKYYGSDYTYIEKLGKYNNIPAPYNNIMLGQEIKIPPLEVLLQVE